MKSLPVWAAENSKISKDRVDSLYLGDRAEFDVSSELRAVHMSQANPAKRLT